jgi:exodeoxyribonuclease V alpha subunit
MRGSCGSSIGAVRAKQITDAWAEQKIVREIMVFLHINGVGTARAVRIYKTYGTDAVQVMTENPYRLAMTPKPRRNSALISGVKD